MRRETDKAFDYTEDYEYDTVLRYAVDVMKGK
jgi:hypothetical protein